MTPAVHPCQQALPENLQDHWLAALDDARLIAPVVLCVLEDFHSANQQIRGCFLPVRRTGDADLPKELDEEINSRMCASAHRIIVWAGGRGIPSVVALGRHELQHAVQYEADKRTFELAGLATDVVRLASDDSGRLYNQLPMEADANRAAAEFVSRRFSGRELTTANESEGYPPHLRRSPKLHAGSLVDATIVLFANNYDLCRRHAVAGGGSSDPDATFGRCIRMAADVSAENLWHELRSTTQG